MQRVLSALVIAAAAIAWIAPARADCTCRALGRMFELGQSVCLKTPQGPRMATCGMVLNNTAWEMSDTPCPAASAGTRIRAALQAPAERLPASGAYPRSH